MGLRLVFMGTPDFSVPILRALVAAGHDIAAVYSQPPRPAGRRGLELTLSPVHKAAQELNIPVFTPKSLKSDEEQQQFSAFKADAAVVVAYGLLLPKAILNAPRLGCYNGHASLLPRWRGAAPIQRAIMAGDTESGMMIMKMDEGLDTGPVALTKKVAITDTMTAGELHDILSAIGAPLMVEAMEKLENGTLLLTPQRQEGVTYAAKISKEETRINWAESAFSVQKKICGLSPFPGSWCEMEINGKPERVKLLGAKLSERNFSGPFDAQSMTIRCAEGAVELTHLQRAGGKVLEVSDFLRGATVTAVN